MNKYKFALFCVAVLFAPASKGAVTSANAEGYLDRAVRMYANQNYAGCIDQLSQLFRMDIPDSMREEARLYFNLANFHVNELDTLAISPASVHRHEMNFMEGSMWFYNENYKAAVAPFEKVPETAFDKETRADLRYRKAFSYIQVGEYDKAAICLDKLKGVSRYKEETAYYAAFIDYSKGDYEKAAEYYNKVLDASPTSAEAWLGLFFCANGTTEKKGLHFQENCGGVEEFKNNLAKNLNVLGSLRSKYFLNALRYAEGARRAELEKLRSGGGE